MVRSPRTQRLLLGVLAVLLAVSGVAFVSTAGAQVSWQQRDAIAIEATEFRVVDGDQPTVEATVEVRNPTSIPITLRASGVVLYENAAAQGNALSTPRSERLADGAATIGAGETATLTVVADLDAEDVEPTRTAIEDDRAVLSGSFLVEMRGRNAYIDV